jgi:hypothetical protein
MPQWSVGQQSRYARIRNIKSSKVRTPEYSARSDSTKGTKGYRWLEIAVEYETTPTWIDQLDFTYYVLMKNEKDRQPLRLFRGAVAYVNVEKGRHEAVMYIHPTTLKRYGDIEATAVIMRFKGQTVAMESDPSSKQRWWEQLQPVDGYILNRLESPFAMLDYDRYEAIKSSSTR